MTGGLRSDRFFVLHAPVGGEGYASFAARSLWDVGSHLPGGPRGEKMDKRTAHDFEDLAE